MLAAPLLKHIVRRGRLTVVDAHGERHVFDGAPGRDAAIRFTDRGLHWRLLMQPGLAFGEGYMNGTIQIEHGSIYDVLALLMENLAVVPPSVFSLVLGGVDRLWRRVQQYNPVGRARENVAHHYDLSGALYDLFLDSDRQYSCAYFVHPSDDLETAQANKKVHIASKLLLEPGMKVLDIGCGWGGLALYLARETGVDVTGLTLSSEQLKVATERAKAAGLADRVRFHLHDYREEPGRYDRIVSVGMFEHVGVDHYPTFFRTVERLLAEDGVALLHSIGRSDGPSSTNAWLRKYIFPGGYSPAVSEVVPSVERAGLWITDMEILRLHYAKTLRHWRERFERNRPRVAALYDERFCRMWEFYLAACELTFRVQNMMVLQMQLAKRVDSVPITREYMLDWERARRDPAPAREAAANVA